MASGFLGATGVALGALAAHMLKAKLTVGQLAAFETGVRYQIYHTLALILITLLIYKLNSKFLAFSGWCFLIGTILFSGSIYVLATKDIFAIKVSWLAPLTPIGGLVLIIGWLMLLVSAFKIDMK